MNFFDRDMSDAEIVDYLLKTIVGVPMPEPIKTIEEFEREFEKPIITPINEILVKKNVFLKILVNARGGISGTVRPTLQTPDFIIRDADESYLFVKVFNLKGIKNYNIAAVNKNDVIHEYLSSVHVKTDNNLINKIKNGAKLHYVSRETFFDEHISPNNLTPFMDAKIILNFETNKQNIKNEPKKHTIMETNLKNDALAQEEQNPETKPENKKQVDKKKQQPRKNNSQDLNPNAGFYSNFKAGYNKARGGKSVRNMTYSDEQVKDVLNKNGVDVNKIGSEEIQRMLRGEKTSKLVPITSYVGDEAIHTEARLAFSAGEDGSLQLKVYPKILNQKLEQYFGHTFTAEQKDNLQKHGHAGELIYADFDKDGNKVPVLVSLDKITNGLTSVRAENIRLPEKFVGEVLTDEQKADLLQGKQIEMHNMQNKEGQRIAGKVQYNAEIRRLDIVKFIPQNKYNIAPIQFGKQSPPLSPEQRKLLNERECVKLDNLVGKNGNTYSAYTMYNDHNKSFVFGKTEEEVKAKAVEVKKNATEKIEQKQIQAEKKEKKSSLKTKI